MNTTRRALLLLAGVAIPSAFLAQTVTAQSTQPETAASGDLSGKWQFVFDTEGGPRTFDADFKLDGKNVTGTWDKKPEVKGTFDAGTLTLEFAHNSDEVGEGTLKLVGKLTDVLTGTWSFQSYDGTFKATRMKP